MIMDTCLNAKSAFQSLLLKINPNGRFPIATKIFNVPKVLKTDLPLSGRKMLSMICRRQLLLTHMKACIQEAFDKDRTRTTGGIMDRIRS